MVQRNRLQTLWQRFRTPATVLLVVGAFVAGLLLRGGGSGGAGGTPGGGSGPTTKKQTTYTCSMHPQVRQPGPGKCPICGMDLIPASGGESKQSDHPRELTMSPRAQALAEIRVASVRRRAVAARVRVVGKVAYDETRTGYLTSWVKGRITKLFVNFTGVKVKRWQPMAYIYSPDLVSAQTELLQALKLTRQLGMSGVAGFSGATSPMLTAARHKLRLLGLSPQQVAQIEKRGRALDHLVIYAPVGGVVVTKDAQEQMYVKPGTRLYTISDLSRVWVKLDVYESEIAWVKLGHTVRFGVEAYPGEHFTGKVAFVDPFVDPQTRTIKVRLDVPNDKRRLKPDMFVRALLDSPVDARGHATKAGVGGRALVIPASAPLITGKRAVVYVERKPGVYRGREVELGPRVGKFYVVRSGLREGERVVVQGNFKIDSALQILAKRSMMNPSGGGAKPGAERAKGRISTPSQFREQLERVVVAYYPVQEALAKDQLTAAQEASRKFRAALVGVKTTGLEEPAKSKWRLLSEAIGENSDAVASAANLAAARGQFRYLSAHLIEVITHFGLTGRTAVYQLRCPMAFGKEAAEWLQPSKAVKNPYHGSRMLSCGSVVATLAGPQGSEAVEHFGAPEQFQRQLRAVLDAYYAVHAGLAADKLPAAKEAAAKVAAALRKADMKLLKGKAHLAWMKHAKGLGGAAETIAKAADIAQARTAFDALSRTVIATIKAFGVTGDPAVRIHCPMAFQNRGADWLQPTKETRNPYYGAKMLRCGEAKETIGGAGHRH